MTRIQQWAVGTVVAVLVLVAAGWFLAIAPQKHKVSNLSSQSTQQEQSNDQLRNRVSVLTAQMSAVPAEEASVAAIAAKIPADPQLPSYVRALSTAAQQTGVELVSIAPGAPTAVVVPAAVVAPVATPSGGATPSATPTTAAAPAVAPASDLQAISISVNVQGGYFQIQQFTAALQRLSRSTVVVNVALAPIPPIKATGAAAAAAAAPSVAFKNLQAIINLNVFMNTSSTFAVIPVPSAAVGATAPAGTTTAPSPFPPSASPSN